MDLPVIFPPTQSRSLPREAGEGWGGGESIARFNTTGPFAPLPASPRKRGEEPNAGEAQCR